MRNKKIILRLFALAVIMLFGFQTVKSYADGGKLGAFNFTYKDGSGIESYPFNNNDTDNVSYTRVPLYWSGVQPNKPSDGYNWAGIKSKIDKLGSNVLIQVTVRGRQNPDKPLQTLPLPFTSSSGVTWAIGDYKSFIKKFIEMCNVDYPGRLKIIGIENEVMLDEMWGGTMQQYVELLTAARQAVDEANIFIGDENRKVFVIDGASVAKGLLWLALDYYYNELKDFSKARNLYRNSKRDDEEVYAAMNNAPSNYMPVDSMTDAEIDTKITEGIALYGPDSNELTPSRKIQELIDYKVWANVDRVNFHIYEHPDTLPYILEYLSFQSNKPIMTNEFGAKCWSFDNDSSGQQEWTAYQNDLFKLGRANMAKNFTILLSQKSKFDVTGPLLWFSRPNSGEWFGSTQNPEINLHIGQLVAPEGEGGILRPDNYKTFKFCMEKLNHELFCHTDLSTQDVTRHSFVFNHDRELNKLNVLWPSKNVASGKVKLSVAETCYGFDGQRITPDFNNEILLAKAPLFIDSYGPLDNFKVYEAEDASKSGVEIRAYNKGYTGNGYVRYLNSSSPDYVEWSVDAKAQKYRLEFRYVKDGTQASLFDLKVNGTKIKTLTFAPTSSDFEWKILSDEVTLNAGINKIQVVATGTIRGVIIDHLAVMNGYRLPIATNENYITNEDVILDISAPGVLANDIAAAGRKITAGLIIAPSNGTLSLNPDGSFSYTPTTNWSGTDNFKYKVYDGKIYSATEATVTIVVKDTTPPVIINNTAAKQKIKLPIVFKAQVIDTGSGVKSVNLIIGATSYAMTLNLGVYQVTLPAKTSPTSITYKFKALDKAGNTKETTTYTLSVVK